jgi:tetratricopeptide (TPR) repeat protein
VQNATPDLIGRSAELSLLRQVFERRSGPGEAFLITGEPGIGKSALLQAAARMAMSDGWRVVATAGVEAEAGVPFGGLYQLTKPLLAEAASLSTLQREALLTALGVIDVGTPPDPILLGLATLNLLTTQTTNHPLAVIADDVQWLDPQTDEVLSYVARRAASARIVILCAQRIDATSRCAAIGLREFPLRGLDDAAADELLRRHASSLPAAWRDSLLTEASGNPLALLELPHAAVESRFTGAAHSTTAQRLVPLSARLERAFSSRLGELPARTRDLLLVAALDAVDDATEIAAAASALANDVVTAAELIPAADAGLVQLADARVCFRHPLMRSAVVQAEPVARRQRAYAALAAAVDNPYRRAWYHAQSIVGPDDAVADELEATVSTSLRRGATMAAIAALERAAELSSDSRDRGHRLLVAARHAYELGHSDLLERLLAEAAQNELTALDRARIEWLWEVLSGGVPGDPGRVSQLVASARAAAEAADDDLALDLLLGAALRCWWADTGAATRALVAAETATLSRASDDARFVAALGVAEPVLCCGTVMSILERKPPAGEDDADALRLLGMAAHAVGDTVRAADYLYRSEQRLRAQGRYGLLPQVLSMEVNVLLELGEWDRARDASEEAAQLAAESGQGIWNAGTIVCAAKLQAVRGDFNQALKLAAQAEMTASRRRLNDLLSCVGLARGIAHFVAGRPAEAYREYLDLFDTENPGFHQRERFSAVMFLAEAAVATGRRAEASRIIAELTETADSVPAPILHMHLAYAKAVLAEGSRAEAAFRDSLDRDWSRWPWVHARLLLAFGRWLLDSGRRTESLELLLAAELAFTHIGAAPWRAATAQCIRAARFP